jgi:hypothetical protein
VTPPNAPPKKRRRAVLPIALVLLALLALAIAVWAIWSPPEPTPTADVAPEPVAEAPVPRPALKPSPPPVAAPEEPAPPEPVVAVKPTPVAGLVVPVVRPSGVQFVTLRAEPSGRPGVVVDTGDGPRSRSRDGWHGIATMAAIVALDGLSSRPDGLRIVLDAGEVPPDVEHVLPLALAIRLDLSGLPFPGEVVFTRFPAPDGTLVPTRHAEVLTAAATHVGYRVDALGDLDALFRGYGVRSVRPSSCVGGHGRAPAAVGLEGLDDESKRRLDRMNRAAPYALSPQAAALDLQEILGSIAAGRFVDDRAGAIAAANLTEQAARALQGAQPSSRTELLELFLAGADLRAAVRVLTLVEERLPGFVNKLARDRRTPDAAELDWITTLVTSRHTATARAEGHLRAFGSAARSRRETRADGPRAGLRGALSPDEISRLTAKTTELRMFADALVAILELEIGASRRLPHPYPWNDLWVTQEAGHGRSQVLLRGDDAKSNGGRSKSVRDAEPRERSPILAASDATSRVGRLWAGLTVAIAFNPEVGANKDGTSRVPSPAALAERLVLARTAAAVCGDRVETALGGQSDELFRIEAELVSGVGLLGVLGARPTDLPRDLPTVKVGPRGARSGAAPATAALRQPSTSDEFLLSLSRVWHGAFLLRQASTTLLGDANLVAPARPN